ncbi:hypothetical protein [Streptosporangium sp. NPDC003464]
MSIPPSRGDRTAAGIAAAPAVAAAPASRAAALGHGSGRALATRAAAGRHG